MSVIRQITALEAENAVSAGLAVATERGVHVAITVIDRSGEPLVLRRSELSALATGQIATAKARTALSFNRPTGAWTAAVQPGAPLYGVGDVVTEFTALAGGVPLADQGGPAFAAVGVSGGAADDDTAIADAVVARLGRGGEAP